jgi:hypothetical protein
MKVGVILSEAKHLCSLSENYGDSFLWWAEGHDHSTRLIRAVTLHSKRKFWYGPSIYGNGIVDGFSNSASGGAGFRRTLGG